MYTLIYQRRLSEWAERLSWSPGEFSRYSELMKEAQEIDANIAKYGSAESESDPGGRHARFLEGLWEGKQPAALVREIGIRRSQPWTWRTKSRSFCWAWDAIYLMKGKPAPKKPETHYKGKGDGIMF